ncbi:MAG: SH3 domain-containing protein [Pseudoruegeria sp.]
MAKLFRTESAAKCQAFDFINSRFLKYMFSVLLLAGSISVFVVWLNDDAEAPLICLDHTEVSLPEKRGLTTNLPIPRFISLRSSTANVRNGPSLTHRIEWVYLRRGLPLMVIGEHGHWRYVEDRDGMGGWIHYSLTSGRRTVLITEDLAALMARPDGESSSVARLRLDVVAKVTECQLHWCQVETTNHKGWVRKKLLWGVRDDEVCS